MELFEILKTVWRVPLGSGETAFLWGQAGWLVNGICWLLDLYPLVKKNSRQETIAVMMLPGFIMVAAASVSSLFLGISTGVPLQGGLPLMRERVCVELIILAALFLALWFLAIWLRGSRNDTWKKRLLWAVSYVPDLIVVGCIIVVSLSRLFWGTYLLSDLWDVSVALGFTSYNIFAWLYVYGITTLLIRLALLLVAIFSRLVSMRIPIGAYGENSHPTRRFLWYSGVCQNAYLRGVMAFFTTCVLIIAVAFWMEGADDFKSAVTMVVFLLFFGAIAFGAALVALKPTVGNLRRFGKWGDKRALLEQFCREYFNEQPILRTENYTMTRHFLVDERSVAGVYYLEMLKGWSCCQRVMLTEYEQQKKIYWSQPHTVDLSQRSGWQWEIAFLGEDVCIVEKEDESAQELIKCIGQYWDSHQLEDRLNRQSDIRPNSGQGDGFDKLFEIAVGAVCFLLMAAMIVSGLILT